MFAVFTKAIIKGILYATSTAHLRATSKRIAQTHLAHPAGFLLVQEWLSMDFSPDGRYLAVQGGGPDWPLALWLWEKSKLCGMYRPTQVRAPHHIHQMSTACTPFLATPVTQDANSHPSARDLVTQGRLTSE
jgi:hypothetical protein